MKLTCKICLLGLLLPTLLRGQETGLLRIDPDNREPLTHVAVWGGIEDGRFRPTHEPIFLWKAGAEARRVAQRPHTTLTGTVSFEQKTGKYVGSSLLLDPFHYPMDILDFSRGMKSQQDLRLEGSFLTDVDDIWAAGLKGSLRAEHASKQQGTPYSNIGIQAELEPVATYLIDDNIGFVAAYRGRLRTENVQAKPAGEDGGLDGLFLDQGMRYGTYQGLGSAGAFSILEFTHGFSALFRSPEESWGLDMLWKRGSASGNDREYRFPGSTLRAFVDYDLALDDMSHLFGFSYSRERDQLRLCGADGAFSSLSDRVVRNASLKYRIRFNEGVVKSVSLVLDGNRRTNRAFLPPSLTDGSVRYDGSATVLTSLSSGIFDLDVKAMGGAGSWKGAGESDVTDQTSTVRLTNDWLQQLEFLRAPQIGLGGTLTAHIPSVDGLFVRLDAFWHRALKVYRLPGKNREIATLTIGYDY